MSTTRPRTLDELYAREERRALDGLSRSAGAAFEDVKRATRVEEHVREHPLLTLGAAAVLGYAAAPLLARSGKLLAPLGARALGVLRAGRAPASGAWIDALSSALPRQHR